MSIHSMIDDMTIGEADEQVYLDRLDRIYRDPPEQMISTGSTSEQAFTEQLAALVAELKQMRLLLVEIGRALAP